MDNETRQTLTKAFPFASHKWRVLNTTKAGDKATWYVYIDARDVAERLDSTGLDWSDEYEVITMTDKLCVVQCRLTIGDSTRTDVGSDSKNSIDNEGNYIKGAFSDALKRAAVKFGIGRYLYGMTSFYVPLDEYKKFTPEAVAKIKTHLAKELKAFGASGSVEDLRGDDEPEPVAQPQPASNGNGRKTESVEETAKLWASDPLILIRSNTDYQFSGPAEAIGWGNATGVFKSYEHAQNAYEEIKRTKKPKSPTEMWALWLGEVASRINEAQKQAA